MQQNSQCRLCGDREETINHIISECNKLTQKEYKTRHDCMGKVIHWELCKKLTFNHMNKWYMHNPESVLNNDTHKLLWDFKTQTDHLISARETKPYNNQQKRENLQDCGLCCPGGPYWKKAKRGISTCTLIGIWKNCGTRKWRLYRL